MSRPVLRRTGGTANRTHTLTFHNLALDEETRDVWRGGRFIDLTPTEYKLLHYLLSNSKRVVTRDQILEAVWDYTFAGNASVLETYISYLRHKIEGRRIRWQDRSCRGGLRRFAVRGSRDQGRRHSGRRQRSMRASLSPESRTCRRIPEVVAPDRCSSNQRSSPAPTGVGSFCFWGSLDTTTRTSRVGRRRRD